MSESCTVFLCVMGFIIVFGLVWVFGVSVMVMVECYESKVKKVFGLVTFFKDNIQSCNLTA